MEITFVDLKAYVAQLAPDEEVGECGSRYFCLVAKACRWKYPDYVPQVASNNGFVTLRQRGDTSTTRETVELSLDVRITATKFDDWEYSYSSTHPTKAELAEYMPELFTQEGGK